MLLEPIQMFLKAADENNIKHAAKYFNTTKDRIRNKIIQLENDVGRELLVKTPNGSYLNNDGEIMYKAFEEMMIIYNNALLAINRNHHDDLDIFTFSTTKKQYDSYFHNSYNENYKIDNCQIQFKLMNYDELYDSVNKEWVDFALLYSSNKLLTNKSLVHLLLYEEQLCLLISPNNNLSKYDDLDIYSIKNQTIYFDSKLQCSKMRSCLNKLSKHNQVKDIDVLYNAGSYSIVKEEGACILGYYKDSLNSYNSGLIPVPINNTNLKYYLVFRDNDEKKSAFAKQFITFFIANVINKAL